MEEIGLHRHHRHIPIYKELLEFLYKGKMYVMYVMLDNNYDSANFSKKEETK